MRAAIIAMPGLEPARLVRLVQSMSEFFPWILVVPNLFGVTAINVVPRQVQGILGLELRQNLLFWWSQAVKRLIDLILIVFLLPWVLIVGMVISFAILIESGRPLFYIHNRIGRRGKPFRAWKFRSMLHSGDEVFKSAMDQSSALKEEWEQSHKIRDDPRLTFIGKVIRRLSLDELPQCWNVLKGDMSIVGPRPIIAAEIPKYGEAFELYKQVRPGLTGLWQVSGRSDLPYQDRVWLDSHYVRNWSIWLDIIILIRTVGVVLTGKGAY